MMELAAMRMLLLLPLLSALARTCQVHGFLDDCGPVDRGLAVDGVPVLDTLATFHRDLTFVRALSESRQAQNYSRIADELDYILSTHHNDNATAGAEARALFLQVTALLNADRVDDAKTLLDDSESELYAAGWPMTYHEYLRAEACKLTADDELAAESVMLAYLQRRSSPGVSMNELERLDGLIALQKVSQFNQDVDRLYGLRQSPDYALLPVAHSLFAGETGPLNKVRTAIFDRLLWTAALEADQSAVLRHDARRLDPELDDFRGRSLPDASARAILCEFARKLSTLGLAPNYTSVMRQLGELDAEFAAETHDKIARHVPDDIERATAAARDQWVDMMYVPPFGDDEVRASFAGYFNVDLSARSANRCNLWLLNFLQEDLDTVKWLRMRHRGVSLDKLAEMEAKFVLNWLGCFHERLKLAYDLGGRENRKQLRTKRTLLGPSCTRTIDDSPMLQLVMFGSQAS